VFRNQGQSRADNRRKVKAGGENEANQKKTERKCGEVPKIIPNCSYSA
jgi:hypothetical protein